MDAIHSATPRDVLSGRGQGVQRHGGNVKYRHLVYVNKGEFLSPPTCGLGRVQLAWHGRRGPGENWTP